MSELVTLGDVVTIDASIVDPRDTNYSTLPHVSAENIRSITGELCNIRSAGEDRMISGKYLFVVGDVLYSKLRPYLRKVALPDFTGVCSADIYPIRAESARLDPAYLRRLLSTDAFTLYANSMAARSRMPKINREQLLRYRFRLPPLAEQRVVALRIQNQLAAVEEARAAAEAQLKEIQGLPGRILAGAFGDAPAGANLADAFDLLADMPGDCFADGRDDRPPQHRPFADLSG